MTTLARILRLDDLGRYEGGPVDVLVCRSTASSSASATVAVAAAGAAAGYAGAGVLPVLVVVGDGPWRDWPPAVRARMRMLRASVHDVVAVPYVARWRWQDEPLANRPPAEWLAAARKLDAVLRDERRLRPAPTMVMGGVR